jgi:hypothetical protein
VAFDVDSIDGQYSSALAASQRRRTFLHFLLDSPAERVLYLLRLDPSDGAPCSGPLRAPRVYKSLARARPQIDSAICSLRPSLMRRRCTCNRAGIRAGVNEFQVLRRRNTVFAYEAHFWWYRRYHAVLTDPEGLGSKFLQP